MAVVTPLNNPGGPEGDTVTVDEQLLNTQYSILNEREIERERESDRASAQAGERASKRQREGERERQ